jgi:ABC-type branched-subunit amino acid transport system substrate-binding protein
MRQKSNKILVAIILMVFLITFVLGCATQPAPQTKTATPTKEVTLRIAMSADATGPYAVTTGPPLNGLLDFAKWANENNYIPGIKLDAKTYDHGLDMTRCVSSFKDAMTATPKPVIHNAGIFSDAMPILKSLATRYQVPLIDASAVRSAIYPVGWYFAYQPSWEGQVGAFADWIVKEWKPDSKVPWIKTHYQNRAPRLAMISWDMAMARANYTDEAVCYVKSKGIEFTGVEYIPLAQSDITPQLSRVKDKADFIYIGLVGSGWSSVLKAADQLGMRDQFIDIGPVYFSPLEVAKFAPNLANNNGALAILDLKFSNLKPYIQTAHKARGYPESFMSYMVGWSWGDIASQVIRKTAERVGADKVDGMACYETLCAGDIKDFRPMNFKTSITWANNPKLVKMAGANSVDLLLIQNWDTKPETLDNSLMSWPQLSVPRLMPNEPDVPLDCVFKK